MLLEAAALQGVFVVAAAAAAAAAAVATKRQPSHPSSRAIAAADAALTLPPATRMPEPALSRLTAAAVTQPAAVETATEPKQEMVPAHLPNGGRFRRRPAFAATQTVKLAMAVCDACFKEAAWFCVPRPRASWASGRSRRAAALTDAPHELAQTCHLVPDWFVAWK